MRKKLAVLLGCLLLFIVLAVSGAALTAGAAAPVANEEELMAAIENGGDIQLSGDIALSGDLRVSRPFTMDFNGYTITGGRLIVEKSTLTGSAFGDGGLLFVPAALVLVLAGLGSFVVLRKRRFGVREDGAVEVEDVIFH